MPTFTLEKQVPENYHAIGMEAYNALPNLFNNADLADELEADELWWSHTTMFPHSSKSWRVDADGRRYLVNEPAYHNATCVMEHFIKYEHSTKTFKKCCRSGGIEIGA